MDHEHQDAPSPAFWRSSAGLALLVATTVGGFYLLTEHAAHVFGVLPYLLLLACPLMHVLMHHGRGHRGHSTSELRSTDDERRRQ